MPRWDVISWWATGLFALGIVLGTTISDLYFLVLVGSYMLRPTLYALGIGTKHADERQMLIQHRSGNLSLTVLLLALVIFTIKSRMEGKPADDFILLICIGIAARATVGLLMIGDYRAAGVRIAVWIGALWMLFSTMEGGLSFGALMEATPGIVILLIGLFGIKRPVISAWILVGLCAIAFVLINCFTPHKLTLIQFSVSILVCIPLGAAAFCFYKGSHLESNINQS